MRQLASVSSLIVSQRKEWGEILSGLETKNKYTILDETGGELYFAMEKGGSVLVRSWLKALRPFEIIVMKLDGSPAFRIRRPFRFYFHQVRVLDPRGRLVGSIRRRFALLRRNYAVCDAQGREIYQLLGPLLHPWTFEIRQGELEFGRIIKRWSGLMKEAYTDSDNFGIEFPAEWPVPVKALMLGVVFLIDFVHFENTSGKS